MWISMYNILDIAASMICDFVLYIILTYNQTKFILIKIERYKNCAVLFQQQQQQSTEK